MRFIYLAALSVSATGVLYYGAKIVLGSLFSESVSKGLLIKAWLVASAWLASVIYWSGAYKAGTLPF